jgi:hypothetical protein
VGALRLSFALQSKAAIVSPGVTEQSTHPISILLNTYFKNNLRIDYKKRDMFLCTLWIFFVVVVTALSCGFLNITRQTNVGILGIKKYLYGTKGTFVV